MADLSKIKLNGTTYNLKDNKARVIYIDIIPEEDNFVTSEGYTYAQLKEMTENKDNIVCLRYGEKRWYLTDSSTINLATVGGAIVGQAVLTE